MIRNYFTIALRSLSKNLGYTAINITGLGIGLACCFIIALFVKFELSYEDFQEKGTSIYRYIPRSGEEGNLNMQTMVPAGFGPLIKSQFHEVEMFSRYSEEDEKPLLRYNQELLDAKPLALVDPDFFKMFSFPIVQGNVNEVLARPYTIVIAKSVADNFFPKGNAVGQIVRYDNKYDFEVTGVFEDSPRNTHLRFTYAISFDSFARMAEDQYGRPLEFFQTDLGAWNYSTYFYIPNQKNTEELAARIDKAFTEARKGEFTEGVHDWLQPLNEIHFTQGIRRDSADGDMQYVYLLSAVALLILVIACFNFMNLSTARAIKRAKEVGLRKVMGAIRSQLIKQFLGETLILVFISLLLGVLLLELFVPLFNNLMGLQLHVDYFGRDSFLWMFVLGGMITGIMAGSYPAFYLSSFVPAKVLKSQSNVPGSVMLRKVLTVMQFGMAAFLLIGTVVVYQQMDFISKASLGFDKESVIYFGLPSSMNDKEDVFKQSLLTHSEIKGMTSSNGVPGYGSGTWIYEFPGSEITKRSMNTLIVDYDYLDVFGLEIVEGRNISREFSTDSNEGYLVNETAVKDLMLDNPIGASIQAMDGHPVGKIVGVVKDFHYRSLHRKIEPLILRYDPRNSWCTSVKMSAGNISERLKIVEDEWKKLAPEYPFQYQFVDETFDRLYQKEKNTSVLLTGFSTLAIIIACLGLLGLTTFMTEQRKKEIGVRKVLGASVGNIVLLLSRDFSKLILIAFAIALPAAWYVMDQWLDDFAYKTTISIWLVGGAGMTILILAWSSISYQSVKAARIDPAETLRSE
jgi:putative ABC transport system permease protein